MSAESVGHVQFKKSSRCITRELQASVRDASATTAQIVTLPNAASNIIKINIVA